MLVVAIVYHVRFMLSLRRQRAELVAQGLVPAESKFPPSLTLIIAVLLLVIGLAVVARLSFNIGPFG
jgi:putative membrane protein